MDAMSAEARKLLERALALPSEERMALIEALTDSIDGEMELSPDWRDEIARRIERLERGDSKLVSGADVADRIQRILGRP